MFAVESVYAQQAFMFHVVSCGERIGGGDVLTRRVFAVALLCTSRRDVDQARYGTTVDGQSNQTHLTDELLVANGTYPSSNHVTAISKPRDLVL